MGRRVPNPPPPENYVRPPPPPEPPKGSQHVTLAGSNIFIDLGSNKEEAEKFLTKSNESINKSRQERDKYFYITLEYDCADWQDPQWQEGGKVHNWHNYASDEMQRIWNTFTDEQKQVISLTLNEIADNEYWE